MTMNLFNIKKIVFASAIVVGNIFSLHVGAQTNLITSFDTTATVSPSNMAPQSGAGSYNATTGTLTPVVVGPTYNATGLTNLVTLTMFHNYRLSYTVTGGNLMNFYIGSNGNPSLVQAGGTAGSHTATIGGFGNSFQIGIYSSNSTAFTITGLSLIDLSAPPAPSVDLTPNAYALRSVYNVQSAALNAGLSYDCNVFDKEGMCLSTGGRYSVATSPETTTTSGLLIGSYKYDKNVRLGAWVDQNLSVKNVDGIKLSNSQPLFGVFGVWSERNDGLGYEVKVSAGYGDKDVTVTRTSTNEGSSKIQSRGIQTVSSYGISIDGDWIAAPYVGVKYTSLKRGSYVEGGSSGALTYDTLRQETTAALAGVKFTGKIDPQTFAVVSAGVETDLSTNNGQYSAGSSNTIVFNANPQRTRPVVSAGVYYDIDKTQRLGVNATVRQEAFESTSSTSVLATYTVGF